MEEYETRQFFKIEPEINFQILDCLPVTKKTGNWDFDRSFRWKYRSPFNSNVHYEDALIYKIFNSPSEFLKRNTLV